MNNIIYKKMSLFDAPKKSIIVHAVNCQGVWGSGIAKEFKEKYPHSYRSYKNDCDTHRKQFLLGYSGLSGNYVEEHHWIGWLYTSENYGDKKDSKEVIKINTTLAVKALCQHACNWDEHNIYSNKFNSGLFDVPWEETELILNIVLKHYPKITWIVCDPNLEENNG